MRPTVMLAAFLTGCVTHTQTTTRVVEAPGGMYVSVLPPHSELAARYMVMNKDPVTSDEGTFWIQSFDTEVYGTARFSYHPGGREGDYSDDVLVFGADSIPNVEFLDYGLDGSIDALLIGRDREEQQVIPVTNSGTEYQSLLPVGESLLQSVGIMAYTREGTTLLQEQYGPK